MNDKIVKRERVDRTKNAHDQHFMRSEIGHLLTMEDGSKWFHPFSGGTPTQERKSDKQIRLENG